MSKLTDTFAKGKTFAAFLTGGDPDLETTERLIPAMAEAGADIIEIGIPFSDPIAEGPVIQAASERALQAGCTVDKLFALVRRVRQITQIPLVFMTYANPIFAYGTDRFLKTCRDVGIDGIIVPDVPFEEREELAVFCRTYGVDQIAMVAPTSQARAAEIARATEGFLYCVSSLGVTGMRSHLGHEISQVIQAAKGARDIPCAIGFGIRTPAQARDMAQLGDGVIVGSAIVDLIARHGADSAGPVCDYIRSIKAAISDS